MRTLDISKDIKLPIDFVTTASAVLAIRGAGKSYTAAVIAEEVAGAKVPFVVLDPTGVWWGLRSSADGKSAGLPVVVMGGNHGDVPLEETAGEVVAEFVVSSGASVILDLSLMRKNAQKRFAVDFLEHLYHLKGKRENQDPLLVILDEADRFAPQKPQPEHARLLGAVEDCVRLGRSRGFGTMMITQRSAVLNKDVLTQVETLILLRTTSPQDRKAIGEWVRENATDEEFAEVMKTISSMENGVAWVWSPSLLKLLKKVRIRLRSTFNSSATPKVGEKRIEPKVIAPVDLEALKGRIAETIEKAKANDPKALKAKIAALERTVAGRLPAIPVLKEKIVEVPVFDIKALQAFSVELTGLEGWTRRFEKGLEVVREELGKALTEARRLSAKNPAAVHVQAQAGLVRVPTRTVVQHEEGDKSIPAGARKIVSILAQRYPNATSRNQVATLTGIKPGGSTFTTYIGILRRAGFVEPQGDGYSITEAGRQAVGNVEPAPTDREEVLRLWSSKLPQGARNILETVVREGQHLRADLGKKLGIEPEGSTMTTYLGILRRNGLINIDRGSGIVYANQEVFS